MSVSEIVADGRDVSRVTSLASSEKRVNLLLFVLLLAAGIAMAASTSSLDLPHYRYKRGFVKLCLLMYKYTGRPCLDYNKYGCYCGLGNTPGPPVDDVDSCCETHDNCYSNLKSSCLLPGLFVTYSALCNQGTCKCLDWTLFSRCPYKTCQCDLAFAQCLKTATYNSLYKNYCPR